ncbi:MAG: LpxL/LpxP family Kdo(2)-lipid IV(A) lauroyl/palmitoleoyl acyltransferase [Proteobacteria bacterium]|nr:LpxL/LpxP family Kdo(2)-lipid IV(A) lauroyl/palmitoleoyl acyltransferase [Pseudomonadota bacterium]
MRLRLFAPRYWPTWIGLGLLRLLVLLPFPALCVVGRGIGALMLRLPLRFAAIARRNIEICLPELDGPARERLLVEHFASLGMSFVEIPLAWWCPPRRMAKLIRTVGAEHVHAALARGRGALLLTGHFTVLELAGRAVATITRTGFLYRPPKNEVLAYVLGKLRSRHGGHAIPRDDIRAFIGALKNNEAVWYAPDQSFRKKGAQMVPMFGIPAATNTFTSRLAQLTGAPVLPYFLQRLPGSQGYLTTIYPPLENFPTDDPVADAERFNHMIEAQVRRAPEQYLWIHRRFKGLTPDYPDYYAREAPRQV